MRAHFFCLALFIFSFPLLLSAQEKAAIPLQPSESLLAPFSPRPGFSYGHRKPVPPQKEEEKESIKKAAQPVAAKETPTAAEAPKENVAEKNTTPQPEGFEYTAEHWQEGYRWFADVVSELNGEMVPYPDFEHYEKRKFEDEIMIASDLFFNHEEAGQTLIEDNEAAIPTFLPFPSDAVLEQRMQAIEADVPLASNETVKKFIYYYGVRAHGFTRELRNRAKIYFPLFEEKLRQHGMPDEIKYLAVIESALRPKIASHAGAVGLWQFMPRTGRSFGLKQNYYVDERMDPEQSTEAACRYLKYLYGMFGDWGLAMSAYNCGPGNLRKAIRRSGGKTDFWEIYDYLPRETRSYLPQFIAVMYLFSYSDEHFLAIDEPYHPIETASIRVNDYTNLKRLADELMVCYDDLQNLNPELKRGVVPYYMEDYQVKIPRQRLSYFHANRERILAAASSKGYYESVALTDGSAYSSFWRPVSRTREVTYKPRTPSRTVAQRTRSTPVTPPKKGANKMIYTVKSGDTMSEIATRYDVSVNGLKYWNNLSSSRIYAGQHLTIWTDLRAPRTASTTTASVKKTTPANTSGSGRVHTVRSGDTLWEIARKYGVSVSKIRDLNNLSSDKLSIGQRLKVG